MSSQLVDRNLLLSFLQHLGRCYKHAGVVYLVGGSSLLLVAVKESTYDIDLQFTIPPDHHDEFIRCVRTVGRELRVFVEQASPDEFMPLPAGREERRQFVGRFGMLDVFHFDFYSVALGKLQRGNTKDFADVLNMIRSNVIDQSTLRRFFDEIFPSLETHGLRANPERFRRNFEYFEKRVTEESPPGDATP
ncbi:MAG: hypothetical protein HY259_14730 [Chloroflexi bacterium]|nr:hypothetical protein [Chloroflexota bacterium]MBI3734691.1 hypothetical protein [Chloroflexota bacterium]